MLPLVTLCYPFSSLVPPRCPLLPFDTSCYPLLLFVILCSPFVLPCPPLFPFVPPFYLLLPFAPLVTLCYPFFPLVTLCSLCYHVFPLVPPCFPLLPLVPFCSPLLFLVTPRSLVTPCYQYRPFLFVTPKSTIGCTYSIILHAVPRCMRCWSKLRLARVNSRRFATPPLISLRNDV